MDELVFTPASLIDLLSQIDELKDVDVGITEAIDGSLQLQVGSSIYNIDDRQAVEVSVDDLVVDQVNQANLDAYEDLVDSAEMIISQEPVESGPIKELIKTLLVGGMVRLAAKTLKN